jgi:xanthine dehydrogenase accessory factor
MELRKRPSPAEPRGAPEARPEAIFRFLAAARSEGRSGALVTITGLEGTGARAVGTHMAVLGNGDSAGSLSSGCVEAAIHAEAQAAIGEGGVREIRFGRGSPYIDIRLPCGGGMDVLILPNPAAGPLASAADLLDRRVPARIALGRSGAIAAAPGWRAEPAEWHGEDFVLRHLPRLRLSVAGHGAEALGAARLARLYGAEVRLLTPDAVILEAAAVDGVEGSLLVSTGTAPAIEADPWTAILLLFHEHEWETALLAGALAGPAFWIGAMGSRATHAKRCAALAERGVAAADIARIRGPVGLIPATRDPATLALSALAEIAAAYQAIPA